MDLGEARKLLLEQHVQLRRLLAEGDVAAARVLFEEHNRLESRLLGPFLEAAGVTGALRLARMVEEHIEEHAAFQAFLDRPAAELAAELPDFVEELDAHIDAEERTFLAPLRR